MIACVVDAILGLSGVWAYAAIGGLAFGETAAFGGLVLPGKAAVLLRGVARAPGTCPAGPDARGDGLRGDPRRHGGYAVGRRYGARLLELPGARRYTGRLDGARRYLRQRGGRAVLLGRWTSVLRALVPGLAGMSRMPFGRFLVFDVASGAAWATMFTLLGYAAGAFVLPHRGWRHRRTRPGAGVGSTRHGGRGDADDTRGHGRARCRDRSVD